MPYMMIRGCELTYICYGLPKFFAQSQILEVTGRSVLCHGFKSNENKYYERLELGCAVECTRLAYCFGFRNQRVNVIKIVYPSMARNSYCKSIRTTQEPIVGDGQNLNFPGKCSLNCHDSGP
ncbi:hypothetical protein LOAG_01582 [Loa loa]|uniref:Uncharacterized protein n=1 Tax=Loa loa TaxID=7209 RepID=A0A1S0U8P9_LOALO|nr:hypothetical protein LOAG_01582 [Loa loa]EFO26907.1 hypothetical protein LOAG_01582 [Loa loa]